MTILFRPKFVKDLKVVFDYLDNQSVWVAENFMEQLEEMVYQKIPKQPFLYQEFSKMPSVGKVYRRATFNKKWYIVYKVEPTQITYITIFHSSRDITKMNFDY
jgi:addiction module RelE/StbE family toxin